ncbi:OPT oligopeptide transporter protein-domain-containing protein, partial [Piptocephalis cylindrospora]
EPSIMSALYEEFQFTWRASIVGSLLGCLVAASNMYLGLKIGWTFGASLFGAIFSFAILRPMSAILPRVLGGGHFGPKENCSAQSAATTAGGLSSGFVSGIPAMYRLGLMSADPTDDLAGLILWTLAAAFYGLFFAIPLRKHFVINQDLTFPTPRAAAATIRQLHDTVTGERDAMRKAVAMSISFMIAFIVTLIAYWVPFVNSIHILFWIGTWAHYPAMANADTTWAWTFNLDWAFFGAGMMTPGATVFSFFAGQLIGYGIAGPIMVTKGYLLGSYGFTKPGNGTAQSWFLWPGIALMVLTSFAEVAIHYRTIGRGFVGGYRECVRGVVYVTHQAKRVIHRRTAGPMARQQQLQEEEELDPNDPVPKHEQVPLLWWGGGLVCSMILTCVIMGRSFHIPVYQTIIAIILSFILAFIGLQAAGETDINPLGTIGKITQVVFCKFPADDLKSLQRADLMSANVTSSAAAQAVDMVGDLKTGQLLGASPRSQFLAQCVGSVFAVAIAVPLFILYAKAYPCIVDASVEECQFSLVAVNAWQAVTKLLTTNAFVPMGSIVTAVILAVLAVGNVILKHYYLPESFLPYWPNLNAVGIGFINSSPEIPIAMIIGWSGVQIWKRLKPQQAEEYLYAIAGGLIAGVGIGGLLQAVFQVANVESATVTWGC